MANDLLLLADQLFDWLARHKDALTSIGVILGFAIICRGLREYERAQRWKKTEFVAMLYKQFSDDRACRHAMWMLDGDDRTIYFEEGEKLEPYDFNQEIFLNALRTYSHGTKFSPIDLHIRDSLDRFLIYLEQFDRAIQNNLVDKQEVYPYFGYWIDVLNGAGELDEKEREVQKSMALYIKECGFDHAERFLRRWSPSR